MDYLDKISAQKCLIFNTLVRCGNVATTSRLLKLPVSKIHNEIKSIEKAVGSPILLRDKRRIVLTEVGTKLSEFSKIVVENLRILEKPKNTEEVQEINIATTHSLAEIFLPSIIKKLRLTFPKILLNVFSGLEYLDFTQQDIDVVIGPTLDNRSDLTKTYIRDFTYSFYASKEYILKKGLPETLKDLEKHEIAIFKGLLLFPKNVKIPSNVVLSSTNYRSLLECIRQGVAVGLLCKEFMEDGFYSDKNLVSVATDFVTDPLRIHFMSRKFTNKSFYLNKLQEITLKSIKSKQKNP